jgi:hypothetical protein
LLALASVLGVGEGHLLHRETRWVGSRYFAKSESLFQSFPKRLANRTLGLSPCPHFVAQGSELAAQYIYYKQIPHDNHIILPCIFLAPDRFGSRDKTHPAAPAHLFFSEVESHPYLTHKPCGQVENLVTRSISIYIITIRPKYR